MRSLSKNRAFMIGTAVPTAILLAACSSSSNSSTPAGSGGSGGSTAAAGATSQAAATGSAGASTNPSATAPAAAFAPTPAETQVCNAAKSEGQLNFEAGSDTDSFDSEIKAFNALYPWIKIHFTSGKPQNSVPPIVAEAQAHHALTLDALKLDIPGASPLITQHLVVTNVNWVSLGVPQDEIVDTEGVATVRTERESLGLAYNTTRFKASDLPNTWEQLVNSKFAKQVIVDPRAEQLGGLAPVWGQAKTVAWYKQLLATDQPVVVSGASASLQKVISGEVALSTSAHDAEVNQQKASGAPVALKYLDVVPTQDDFGYVLAGAAHPNAAKCFLAWFANPNGGAVQQLKYEFKANATDPVGLPATSKLAAPDTETELTQVANTADALAKLTPQ